MRSLYKTWTPMKGADNMGIFNDFLADFGLGLARVNIVLEQQAYRLGEEIKGKLIVHSGNIDQRIDMVYLHLKMDAKQGTEHLVRIVNSIQVSDGFFIKANSPLAEYSFTYRLPYYTPVTTARINYKLAISVNKKSAAHPHDFFPIRILPSMEMETVLKGLEQLGFITKANSGEMEHDHQNFVFYPTNFMQGKFNELEIMFNQNKSTLFLYLEIDRKAKGLTWLFIKPLYLDEQHNRFAIPASYLVTNGQPQVEKTSRLLSSFIQQKCIKKL